jgi:hypothetical protein
VLALLAPLALAVTVGAGGCGSTTHSTSSAPAAVVHPPAPSPQAEQVLLAAIKTTRRCMAATGLHVSGGPVYPQQSPTSPDGELIVGSAKGGAFIAFYTGAARAAQLEPEVRQNARRSGGQVERRGAVTVLLFRHPASNVRQAVLTCAFG